MQRPAWETQARTFRLFTSFWLAGWYVKAWFFSGYLFSVIDAVPWSFDFFPSFFRSPAAARFFYVLPAWSAAVFLTRRILFYRLSAWIMIFSSAALAVHQDTCNDATFVTSFWTGVWALWLACRREDSAENVPYHAKALAALIIGMIFTGGCVGKWTGGYWDGTVLANVFGAYEAGLGIEWIKHSLPPQMQADAFRVLSRLVIFCEGFLSLSPFLPYPFLVRAGVPILLGFALTNTVWIYSVLMCLLGMIFAARQLEREFR